MSPDNVAVVVPSSDLQDLYFLSHPADDYVDAVVVSLNSPKSRYLPLFTTLNKLREFYRGSSMDVDRSPYQVAQVGDGPSFLSALTDETLILDPHGIGTEYMWIQLLVRDGAESWKV